METTDVARTATRVPMVEAPRGLVRMDVADLRGEPRADSELVDQAHMNEAIHVLGAAGDWRYVQGEDHYFGWIRAEEIFESPSAGQSLIVGVLLAEVHEGESRSSTVIARFPAGTRPSVRLGHSEDLRPEWMGVTLGAPGSAKGSTGYVASEDLVRAGELPHRYPTPADLIATAESFLGVPYLWGGTTATGLDCSGFVQQVYRLNGVGLPRDADQQAMFGRPVENPSAGDLLFFGQESVTHVALATSETQFIYAPESGRFVERGTLGPERQPRAIRRYLPEVVVER